MGIWGSIIIFIVGIALIIKGGDIFVDAASWIARAAGIPPFIVGATIVSIATTMPEMIVSFIAAGEGKIDMAIGNAVGSVTANTGLLMAIALLFMPVVFRRRAHLLQSLMLIAAAAVIVVGSLTGSLSIWASVILVAIFAAFMFTNVRNAKLQNEAEEKISFERKELVKNIILFVVGAAALVVGSRLLVKGGSEIAAYLGIPERIVAVTLVAVGTSLPELVTTITAIRKKQAQLSVGNIIGANIIDLSLILPICSLISGQKLPVSRMSIRLDLPVCLLVTLIAIVPMLIRQKGSRVQGALLLAVYAAYIVLTV